MYCKQCGEQITNEKAEICIGCGTRKGIGNNFCQECGSRLQSQNAEICLSCGVRVKGAANSFAAVSTSSKSKIVAALLCFFLGGLGVHRFYLGYTTIGIIQIVLLIAGFFTCGITSIIVGIWEIVDLVLILTGKLNHANGEMLD